jgi:hypothetical protein
VIIWTAFAALPLEPNSKPWFIIHTIAHAVINGTLFRAQVGWRNQGKTHGTHLSVGVVTGANSAILRMAADCWSRQAIRRFDNIVGRQRRVSLSGAGTVHHIISGHPASYFIFSTLICFDQTRPEALTCVGCYRSKVEIVIVNATRKFIWGML